MDNSKDKWRPKVYFYSSVLIDFWGVFIYCFSRARIVELQILLPIYA